MKAQTIQFSTLGQTMGNSTQTDLLLKKNDLIMRLRKLNMATMDILTLNNRDYTKDGANLNLLNQVVNKTKTEINNINSYIKDYYSLTSSGVTQMA